MKLYIIVVDDSYLPCIFFNKNNAEEYKNTMYSYPNYSSYVEEIESEDEYA